MTSKEMEYLQDWIYKVWGRAEIEFGERLYFFSQHDNVNSLNELNKSYYKKQFSIDLLAELNTVLKLSLFDDNTKYKNRSAKFLNSLTLSDKEDDLIYSFILGIIHNDKFNLGEK